MTETTLKLTESLESRRSKETTDRSRCATLLDLWSDSRVDAYEDAESCSRLVKIAAKMRAHQAPEDLLGLRVGVSMIKASQRFQVRPGPDGPELCQRDEVDGGLVKGEVSPLDLEDLLAALRTEVPPPGLGDD